MKRATILLLLSFVAAAASAQQIPGRERGFKPEETYQFSGFDSVNLFSGNLNLTIPLGQSYPVANGLSYSFALHYSGNVWHYSEWMRPFTAQIGREEFDPVFCTDYVDVRICETQSSYWFSFRDGTEPGRAFFFPQRDNAGLGWRLSFGELLPSVPNAYMPSPYAQWRWKGPDSGEHGFYSTLHEPRCAVSPAPCDEETPGVWYTRDGTYLRMKLGVTEGDRIVEFPDGKKQLFRCDGPTGECKLQFIYNVHSALNDAGEPTTNFVKFDYSVENQWKIIDSHGRTHYVHFLAGTGLNAHVVDKVELEAFDSTTRAEYNLTYDNFTGGADDGTISQVPRPCGASNRTAAVRLLTRLTLPSTEAYRFEYDRSVPPEPQPPCNDSSSTLTKAFYPTAGHLEWTYQPYAVASSYTSTGVKERKAYTAMNELVNHSVYISESGKTTVETMEPGASAGDQWRLSSRTINYFQATEGKEHGLPYTTTARPSTAEVPNPDPQNRYLSTETYDCHDGGTCGSVSRATYVRYEMDWAPAAGACPIGYSCLTDRNRRMAAESTFFPHDGRRYADTEQDDFDGLGHYRSTSLGGNYNNAALRQSDRQTFTDFNPGVGTYKLSAADGTRTGTYNMFPASRAWILGMHTYTQMSEGGPPSTTETCFEESTGFLKGTRTWASAVGPTASDLLTLYTKDPATGNVQSEQFFGGDVDLADETRTGLPTNVSLCQLALTPPPHDAYSLRVDHSYLNGFGTLTSSRYMKADGGPMPFLNADYSVDQHTGLIKSSVDSAGRVTTYTYDNLGRLTSITPPGGAAPTTYRYTPGASTIPATVTVVTGAPGNENHTEQVYEFDSLGRLAREKRLLPTGFSVRETEYDHLSRRKSISEWRNGVGSPGKTIFSGYDAFGRIGRVTAADGSATTYLYEGTWQNTRTSNVATAATGTTPVSVKEEFDRLGRLIAVTEGIASGSAGQTTTYAYQLGNQLKSVLMGTQPARTFTYDLRGLLVSENHPESETTGYKYNARGQVVRRTTPVARLRFDYDRAERLKSLVSTDLTAGAVSKVIKSFEYDVPPGHLTSQTRHNYVTSGDYVVTDAFLYDAAGRASKKTTTITHGSDPAATFEQKYDYTALNQPSFAYYPTCAGCGTAVPGERAIPLSYKAGLLTGIGNLTAGEGITYSAAGMVERVRHAAGNNMEPQPGVLDEYMPDDSGMPRPKQIKFSNANDCHLITAAAEDETVNAGNTATFWVTAPASASYAWYEQTCQVDGTQCTDTLIPGATTSTLVTPALNDRKTYWCLVSGSSSCKERSRTFVANVCKPTVIRAPISDYTGSAYAQEVNKPLDLNVIAEGTQVAYSWYRVEVPWSASGPWSIPALGSPFSHNAAIQWTPLEGDEGKTFAFVVEVTGGCGVGTQQRLVKVVTVPAAAAPCVTPVAFSSFPSELASSPGQPITLRASILTADGGYLEPDSNLEYRWYVNGNLWIVGGAPYAGTTYTTYGTVPESVSMEVKRKCTHEDAVTHAPVTTYSASLRITTFIYNSAVCPPPPFSVDQLEIKESSTNRKFTVTTLWPSVTFKWYRGDRNTGTPVATGREFTPDFSVGTVWVRATSPCGSIADSPMLTVSLASCPVPVSFTRPPQSADVKAKVPYTLTFDATGTPAPNDFRWFEGPGLTHEISQTRDLVLLPLKTTKYWVRASNNCHYADSALATLHVTSCDDIRVSQQPPRDASINKGETIPLTIAATADVNLSYQWYEGETGDDSHPLSGQTLPTFNAHPDITSKYWVRTSITGGCEIDSATITVHVCRIPEIPQTQTVLISMGPNWWQRLNAYATGDFLSYQWYAGEVGDTANPVGVHEKSVVVQPGSTTKYWFRATSDCYGTTPDATADSPQIVVSVCPAITAQPSVAFPEVMPNTQATITIGADRGDLIEWFRGNPGDNSTQVLGTGATFRPVITATSTFWARVTSGSCSVISDGVTVGVCTQPTIGWAPGIRTQIATGEQQLLSVMGTVSGNYERTHTWYAGTSGDVAGSTVISGPGMAVVQHYVNPTTTTSYWVRLKEASGCYADTPTLTIQVCVPTIRTQPQSSILDTITNPSAVASLGVVADGGTLTYQWYTGQPGDTTNPLAGKTTPSITVSPTADTTYWVRVTGTCNVSKDSAAATVTLCKQPQIVTQPTANVGPSSATLTVSASGTDLTYQWYAGASGVTTSPVANGTTATVTVTPSSTTDYWVRVSGRCGASVNSNSVKVSIAPTITTQPAGSSVMPGTNRTLSVVAGGSQLTYQWYANTTAIAGATAASYTTPAITADTRYWVRVSSGTASTDSADAWLRVCTQPTIVWNQTKTQIAYAETQILSVSATVADASNNRVYTWYSGNAGDVAGSTALTSGTNVVQYATPPLTTTTKYWVRISEGSVCYADTTTLTVTPCIPTITASPQSITINPGTSTTLSVTATGNALTYQWFTGQAGDTSNPIAGQTSTALTVTPAADTTYWVRVTGCQTRNSTAATVTVCKPPQISSQPPSPTLAQPGWVTLNVSATGTDLTYQWYAGTSGNTATPVGSTTNTLTLSATGTTDYWVKVSGRCGSVNSNTAKISVPPSITTQPAGGAVTKGVTRTLTVAASGAQLSYQWYSGTSMLIAGAIAASYTTPPINADISYFARVYSGAAPADSAAAAFTVCQPRNPYVTSNTYVSGGAVTLRVDTVDGNEAYEWYRGESGVTTTPAGNGGQITVNPTGTSRYWVRTKRATCDADSAAITVTVCTPAISAQPQSALIASGTTKTLTVTANGTPALTYQWYIGSSGVTSNPIAGATSAMYTTPALTATTTYWVQVKSPADAACPSTSVNSTAATITVCSPPAITVQPQNTTLSNSSSSVTIQVTATGDNLSYQWYEGASGVTTTPVGTNSRSILVTPGSTKYYWVRITGSCGTINSAAALMSVTPTIYSQPTHQTVCQNSTQTFTVSAGGTNLTYQWFKLAGAQWQPIGNTASITVVVTAAMDIMCTVTSGNASKDTWPATISIEPAPTVAVYKQNMGNNWYKLNAYLDASEASNPTTYAWYKGALGNTSQRVGSDWDAEVWINTTVSQPMWVRVTRTDTGCYTDLTIVIP